MYIEKMLLVGRDVRQGSVNLQEAIKRVNELVLHPGFCEQLLAYVQGTEESLRTHFKACLDADALDEIEEAGGAALVIVEAREDLARLHFAIQLRSALDDQPELSQKLEGLAGGVTRAIRWFDRQADRVGLPDRMPGLLASVPKPEELVRLGWKIPEDWWIGKLIVPPPGTLPHLI